METLNLNLTSISGAKFTIASFCDLATFFSANWVSKTNKTEFKADWNATKVCTCSTVSNLGRCLRAIPRSALLSSSRWWCFSLYHRYV